MQKKKRIKWTEKHKSAARRRLYEIGAEECERIWPLCESMIFASLIDSEREFRFSLKEVFVDPVRIDREVAFVDALATADDTTRDAIAGERARHDRVLRKLASGRYVREEEVRGDVYLTEDREAGVNRNHTYEQAKAFMAIPGIAALKPRIVKRTTSRIRKAG